MKCPFCHESTKVVDKRDSEELVTRRRRECMECEKRFTTYERIELVEIRVVKKDGRGESFNPEKIKSGICLACEKRSVALHEIDALVKEIEAEIRSRKQGEITSVEIGEIVMDRLKELDKVAYIRFASIYRSFTDIASFQKEVHQLLSTLEE